MDKRITDAEAALDRVSWHSPPAEKDLANALSALLTLAKAQEAELARLKAPLGDEGKALVEEATRWLRHIGDYWPDEIADLIERQAAELTAPVDADVEELAKHIQKHWALCLGPDFCGRCPACEAAAMLRRLSRENAVLRELADDAEEMQRDRDDALGDLSITRVENAALREVVEDIRAYVDALDAIRATAVTETGSFARKQTVLSLAEAKMRAILAHHLPAPAADGER